VVLIRIRCYKNRIVWQTCVLVFIQLFAVISMLMFSNVRRFSNCTESPYITKARYLEIMSCIRGIDPDNEIPLLDSWGSSIDTVAKMREFEREMYKMSRKVFVTEHSQLVIADELVVSVFGCPLCL
jgi:hypothetical protein